jgi:hypothetical protein
MIEWYAVRNSTTADEFLARNKEVKKISYNTEPSGRYGRLWVEDIYENPVLLITEIPDGVIREVRCYAPNDPSFILFLLVKRGGSKIMPEESPMFYDRHYYDIKNKDFEIATTEFLRLIKKNKSYKNWLAKS